MNPVRALAPGRVNLIGDHVDYLGGPVLPMTIDRATQVSGRRGGDRVVLESSAVPGRVDLPLTVDDPASVEPAWGRYVAGVVAELRPASGFTGTVDSAVPVGAGLSSSAALELAVALALGFRGEPRSLAELGQRAEQRASGVPCGIMDQLTVASGVAGHALLIDCHDLSVTPVPVPADLEVVVVHSGDARTLAGSAYAERRAACERAEGEVGPLREAGIDDLAAITDPTTRRRARHAVTEMARVRAAAAALATGDGPELGRLMLESHASLRDDFEVSTPALDALVARLASTPGVHGARLTGAGFGGCAVAVVRPGAVREGWVVRPAPGAHRL